MSSGFPVAAAWPMSSIPMATAVPVAKTLQHDPKVVHPALTMLTSPTIANRNSLSDEEKQNILADAEACVKKLNQIAPPYITHVEIAYVAAALAVMCGRFVKGSGVSNPTAAARACGRETKNPKAVMDWLPHLVRLETVLLSREAAEAQRQVQREQSRNHASADDEERTRVRPDTDLAEETNDAVPRVSLAAVHSDLMPSITTGRPPSNGCIGKELKALFGENTACEESFVAGQPHLTNKFCPTCCLEGFAVPAAHIRGLTVEAQARLKNTTCEGFWSDGAEDMEVPFRIINQHKRCDGEPLVLLKYEPPTESKHFVEAPADCVTSDGLVWLRVAYATLVPFTRRRERLRARGLSVARKFRSERRGTPKANEEATTVTMVSLASSDGPQDLSSSSSSPAVHPSPSSPSPSATSLTSDSQNELTSASQNESHPLPQLALMEPSSMSVAPAPLPSLPPPPCLEMAVPSSSTCPATTGAEACANPESRLENLEDWLNLDDLVCDLTSEATPAASYAAASSMPSAPVKTQAFYETCTTCEQLVQMEEMEPDVSTAVTTAAVVVDATSSAAKEATPVPVPVPVLPVATAVISSGEILPRPCAACRGRRVRCDRQKPCGGCLRRGIECKLPPTVKQGRPSRSDLAARANGLKREDVVEDVVGSEDSTTVMVIDGHADALLPAAAPDPFLDFFADVISPPTSPPYVECKSASLVDSLYPAPALRSIKARMGSSIFVLVLSFVVAFHACFFADTHRAAQHEPNLKNESTGSFPSYVYLGVLSSEERADSAGYMLAGYILPCIMPLIVLLCSVAILAAITPNAPTKWHLPCMHAINAVTVAACVHSTLRRYRVLHLRNEGAEALAARQCMLLVSLLFSVLRAVVSSATQGRWFWWSFRLLGAVNGAVLTLIVVLLWALEDPPLYPPNEVPIQGSLAMVVVLWIIAAGLTPSNRRKLAAGLDKALNRLGTTWVEFIRP